MRLPLLLLFAVVIFASTQKTETSPANNNNDGAASAESAASTEETNRRNDPAVNAEGVESGESTEADSTHKKATHNHKDEVVEDANSNSSSDSAEEVKVAKARKRQQVSKALLSKKSAREELEKFVGKFVVDYLVSRLRSATKRLITSFLADHQSDEDDQQ